MTEQPINTESIEYRLVLIEGSSMQILTKSSVAGALLPRETIPAYTRIAESLTEVIQHKYGLLTLQLAFLAGANGASRCAVHEIIGYREAARSSLHFTALDDVAESEFTYEERIIVFRITRGEASGLGKFARLGWIDELLATVGWSRHRSLWPAIQQLNQGIDFCLLSLTDTNGNKMWFKAVGEPNVREYALTAELTQRFPAYLPKILVAIPEWNGWVMQDVQGIPLNRSNEILHAEEALTALATMQKDLAGEITSLLALGAKDWTCARIASLSEPFFTEAWRAIEAQTSTKPRPLDSSELGHLQKDIESTFHEFMDDRLPETLLHGDIGHGNIITSPNGPVFLDWAETYIGHPFLCSEHLVADLTRSNPLFAQSKTRLRSHYAACWAFFGERNALDKVVALAPAMAAFAYAVIAWDSYRDRPDPTAVWPLLRSMLRRTKFEFEQASEVMA